MKTYFDIQGDGGSDIAGQVARQRAEIARRLDRVRHRIAIGSGKGGVGKSTLAAALAATLARMGRRTTILDADLNGPSQARLAGLGDAVPLPGRNGLSVPRNADGVGVLSFGSLVPEPRPVDFDTVARGDSHTWRATREFAALAEILASTDWGDLDFLVFDLPPGAERTRQLADFLGPETAFVLVTVPSDVSRGVVARSISTLRDTPNRVLGYIENMSGYWCAGCNEVKPLFPESQTVRLDLPCLGRVPFDPAMAARADRGEPLDRESPIVREVLESVAGEIGRAMEGRKNTEDRSRSR